MKAGFFLVLFCSLLATGFAQEQCSRQFVSSGLSTFNVPFGITSVTVEVWGAGGKGGDMAVIGGGGGGGGGAYSRKILAVTPGQSLTVFVGEGSNNSSPGGDSWVSTTGGVHNAFVLAKGGQSVGLDTSEGAPGGKASMGIGDVKFDGGKGGDGINGNSGGGGSSGGSSQHGSSGQGMAGGSVEEGGSGGNGIDKGQGSADGVRGGGGSGGRRHTNNPAQNVARGGKGGDGLVRITYNCPDADPNWPDCAQLIDDGALTGEAIIEFLSGVCEWIPPVGLTEFEVMVVGGGGGGGRGEMAGGGGGGGYVEQIFTNINNGAGFGSDVRIPIVVGDGGAGSNDFNFRGEDGSPSGFDNNGHFQVVAGGGGGGGSTNDPNGSGGAGNGASGGGASGSGAFGEGYGNRGGSGSEGENGGAGGGGGGGNQSGISGSFNQELASGGNGGNGVESFFSGTRVIYSGGGGATATLDDGYFSSQGTGGSGVGGVARNVGEGGDGGTPGSGGGAGSLSGGSGHSGVVIVKFQLGFITPVEWLEFSAQFQLSDRSVIIDWSTAKEWENSHFEVERSENGITDFRLLGKVDGMGWTEEISNYSFRDSEIPLKGGSLFYRIKQIDFNGEIQYSEVLGVRLSPVLVSKGVWRAFPNPVHDERLRLELVDAQQYNDEGITLRVLSPTISSRSSYFLTVQELDYGMGEIMSALPKGLWIVEVQWGNKAERLKVIKR